MSELRKILEEFQEYVLHQDQSILRHILPNARMNSLERCEVYGVGYYLRLIEVLTIDYPMIQRLMGEEKFESLARAYIDANPSLFYSVNSYGRHFSDFLKTQKDVDPYYPEMAAFEWELQQVLNTEDAPQITVADMAQVPPEQWGDMQLSIHPSVRYLPFHYNIADVWKCLTNNETPPDFTLQNEMPTCLFWRFDLKAYFVALNSHQTWMLQALREGKTFGEVCEGLCQWLPENEVAQFAAQTLYNWISEGVCSELKIVEVAED